MREITDDLIYNGMKWSSFYLNTSEMNFINSFKNKIKIASDYVFSKPGIVTAANNYFIVSKSTKEKYKLNSYAKPIIQKSVHVGDRVDLNEIIFDKIISEELPCFLLNLPNKTTNLKIIEYIQNGLEKKIHKRYKCARRTPWFKIPMVPVSEAFIFKRIYKYPKIMKNSCEVYTTDAAYNLMAKDGVCIKSFIYSLYNPLTLCFFELYGRRYGGGVLELIPSEFKRLPIPYIEISDDEFSEFSCLFESKESIEDILNKNGPKILNGIVTDSDYSKVMDIYRKLVNRRLNMKSI